MLHAVRNYPVVRVMLSILEKEGTIEGAKTLERREKMASGLPIGSGLPEGADVNRFIDFVLLKALV